MNKDLINRTRMIVFQDFDGVLNSGYFLKDWMKRNPDKGIERFKDEFYRCGEFTGFLVPEKVKMFSDFVYSHEDVFIVCSSSWRIGHDLDYMKEMYKARGLPWDRLIDLTPDLRMKRPMFGDYSSRNLEIYTYLKEHDMKDEISVAIDDDYVRNFNDFPKFKVIETIFEFGVEQYHFEEIEEWIKECNK